jgi:hypothetical protein
MGSVAFTFNVDFTEVKRRKSGSAVGPGKLLSHPEREQAETPILHSSAVEFPG